MAMYAQTPEQAAEGTATDLQQPRNDLQPTGGNSPEQTQNPTQNGGANLDQTQLNNSDLRVGSSTTSVPNTTSASMGGADSMGASMIWLWVILLIVGLCAFAMLVVRKRSPAKTSADLSAQIAAAVESPKAAVPPVVTVKKRKSGVKTTRAKRKNQKSKS